jgi:hypothetical protein
MGVFGESMKANVGGQVQGAMLESNRGSSSDGGVRGDYRAGNSGGPSGPCCCKESDVFGFMVGEFKVVADIELPVVRAKSGEPGKKKDPDVKSRGTRR